MGNAIEFVKEHSGAREFKLSANGLRVLLIPYTVGQANAFMVHYNVGSINEAVGHTGSTHFLEHLLFKGSKNFPKDIDPIGQIFARTGAIANANTWYDRTGYYEIVLPEYLELFMSVEADRMRNATFTDQDRQDEMPVVRNELERLENNPAEVLREQMVIPTAIREHPYHHPTIGWRSDVEGVPTERIREFYDTFYHPNNALIILIGSFDEEQVLGNIVEYFGSIPASPKPIPQIYTQEPPQKGERRVILKRKSKENGIVSLAWMVPGASHPDFPALLILQTILAKGNRALLTEEFVKSGCVRNLALQLMSFRDPFPLYLGVGLLKRRGHRTIEQDIIRYLEKLQREGINPEYVERAKRLSAAYQWYGRDGFINMLMQLSIAEGAGSWELYYQNLEAIQGITSEDVMRVLTTYIHRDNMTVGWFVPQRIKESA